MDCYCGGKLKRRISGLDLSQCPSCGRLWQGGSLLIPWKGFVDKGEGCPRCGGEVELNTRTLRKTCIDHWCGYSWRTWRDRASIAEHRIKEDLRKLRHLMAEADNPLQHAPQYRNLKDQLAELWEDKL